nr:immunoglobulin heavy chain junction region [Macaca mulatta]
CARREYSLNSLDVW